MKMHHQGALVMNEGMKRVGDNGHLVSCPLRVSPCAAHGTSSGVVKAGEPAPALATELEPLTDAQAWIDASEFGPELPALGTGRQRDRPGPSSLLALRDDSETRRRGKRALASGGVAVALVGGLRATPRGLRMQAT